MSLFASFRLSVSEVEAAIHRPLSGDPSRGERGVLALLFAGRLHDARRMLDRDPGVASDFKGFMAKHLEEAERRWESLRVWRVRLPVSVWEEYARESRALHRPIGECLSAAIERDCEARRSSVEPVLALREEVRAYHSAATRILDELRSRAVSPEEKVGTLGDGAPR
jgi:hypothetical protein